MPLRHASAHPRATFRRFERCTSAARWTNWAALTVLLACGCHVVRKYITGCSLRWILWKSVDIKSLMEDRRYVRFSCGTDEVTPGDRPISAAVLYSLRFQPLWRHDRTFTVPHFFMNTHTHTHTHRCSTNYFFWSCLHWKEGILCVICLRARLTAGDELIPVRCRRMMYGVRLPRMCGSFIRVFVMSWIGRIAFKKGTW